MTQATDTAADRAASAARGRTVTVSLRRVRRGRAVAFTTDAAKPEPARRPCASRAAQMLALAHEFQRLVDSGEVPDRATLASQVGLTRARITQIMDLLLLAPDLQEEILTSDDAKSGGLPNERRLRRLARLSSWVDQRGAASS